MSASPYAWIIDEDHLAWSDDNGYHDDKGVIGPRDANVSGNGDGYEVEKAELERNYAHHHQFRMYDDDGELYWNGSAEPEEEYVYGPLGDFGAPNAGAVLIKYTGREEWNCG